MSNRVEFNPHTVRMAQIRCRETGFSLDLELARLAVEEIVVNADPELGLLMDGAAALSAIDCLQSCIGANDVVVRGRRFDVRAVDDRGHLAVARMLVGTPALSSGSLVVQLDGCRSARIIGHLPAGQWLMADSGHGTRVEARVESVDEGFDAQGLIVEMSERAQMAVDVAIPTALELKQLLDNRGSLAVARQRQIVAALCAREELRVLASTIGEELARARLEKILRSESTWNRRVEEMVDILCEQFPSLTREELRRHVSETGERFGGQPQAPAFRQAVLRRLAAEQLARRFDGSAVDRAGAVSEQMQAGRTAIDAVKQIVRNKLAVDLAAVIRQRRQKVEGFVAATAEEIGQAFQQLALKPTYATHSTKDTGVESINEALELLEASEIVEEVLSIEARLIETGD